MIAIFVVTLFDFVYELSSGWVGGAGAIAAASPVVYLTGALTTLTFFLYRVLEYQTKLENASFIRRLSISFFDLITYFCVIFLAVWGLIFPLLRPIPADFHLYLFYQRGLGLNLYVGLIVCASIVIFRAASQPLISRTNSRKTLLPPQEIMIKAPAPAAPAPLAVATPTADQRPLDTLTYEMLASINREIAKMREQINLLTSNVELGLAQRPLMMNPSPEKATAPHGVVRVRAPQNPERPSSSKQQVEVAPPSSNPEKVPTIEPSIENSVYQIPDSARDNPWASILSRRVVPKKTPDVPPAPPADSPMTSLANPTPKAPSHPSSAEEPEQ